MLVTKVLLWDWRRVGLILGELTVDDIFCVVYCCGFFFSLVCFDFKIVIFCVV